jgi:hypothetical protein
VPTINLKKFHLNAALFHGEAAAGPVPALFSEEAEAAKEALASNPQKAHQDVQRLNKIFFMPEHVDTEEATNLVKKPR